MHSYGDRTTPAAESTVLEAREARWSKRLAMAASMGADHVLFTLTLRIPATLRASGAYDERARCLLEDLAAQIELAGMNRSTTEFRVGDDGPEGYLSARGEARAAKELAVDFEERHRWGELVDVDVMSPGGFAIGRSDLGLPPRRCLVCGNDAALCVVARRHSPAELRAAIDAICARAASESKWRGGRNDP